MCLTQFHIAWLVRIEGLNFVFAMLFMYRYPRPAGKPGEFSGLMVIVNDTQMLARRTTHS